MAERKRWSDLSEGTRKLIIIGAAAEGLLKVAALADLRRRPASDVRGPKWLWAAVIVLVNSFGGAPLCYFAFGRRQRPGPETD
ncbi:MAG TPA: PLD nuclease N-terminal domain-containing protein [Streptosporangiaceae bacterium]